MDIADSNNAIRKITPAELAKHAASCTLDIGEMSSFMVARHRNDIALARKLLKDYSKPFEKLCLIYEKYGIDVKDYLRYFILHEKHINKHTIGKLLDVMTFNRYAEDLTIISKHRAVYSYVLKSAKNIAKEAKEKDFVSSKEYVKWLICEGKLSSYFICGKVSQYYLVGLKNFDKIVKKMDNISQDTFYEIVESKEKLYSDLQDAFVYLTNRKVNVLALSDKILTSII